MSKRMSDELEDELDIPAACSSPLRRSRRLTNANTSAETSRPSRRLRSLATINYNREIEEIVTATRAADECPRRALTRAVVSPKKKQKPKPAPVRKKNNAKVKEAPIKQASGNFCCCDTLGTFFLNRFCLDLCNFCETETTQEYLLGEVKKSEDITAHMYCLLFACGLTQKGQPNEGIEGFLLPDIRRELKRGSHLRCCYCRRRGAVVGCAKATCDASYHLPCGIENGTFNHFHAESNNYPSWCIKHRPKMTLPSFQGRKMCTICQESIRSKDRELALFGSCCSSYYHRDCLANLAHHQGYYLRCPNCANQDEFQTEVKAGGIYIPCRPASYELTGELNWEVEVFECVAEVCGCEQGRRFNGENQWELFACDCCGSSAVHVSCGGLTTNEAPEWVCRVCSVVG